VLAAWSRPFSQGGEYARPRATDSTLVPVAKTAVQRSPVHAGGRAAALSSSLSHPCLSLPCLSVRLPAVSPAAIRLACLAACCVAVRCFACLPPTASRCADRCAGCLLPVLAYCLRSACCRCRYWPSAIASFRLGVDWLWGSLGGIAVFLPPSPPLGACRLRQSVGALV